MGTTRQSIIRGPGTVAFGGVKFFDSNGITAEIDSATQEVPSSIVGKLDTIKTDQTGKVTLTPVGNLSEALLGVLFPAWMQTPPSITCCMKRPAFSSMPWKPFVKIILLPPSTAR